MYGSAGLFEQHKLLFSFSMTVKIQEVEDSLNRDELDFFMKVRVQLLLHTQPSSGITSRTLDGQCDSFKGTAYPVSGIHTY